MSVVAPVDPPGRTRPGPWARAVIAATVTLLLLGTAACSGRLADSNDTVSDYVIVVELTGPAREGTTAGGCEIAPGSSADGQFSPDATFLLENDSGIRLNSAQMPLGVRDEDGNCRVPLYFTFVTPDSPAYLLRTNRGTGWWLTNAEAFARPTTVIDVMANPPA